MCAWWRFSRVDASRLKDHGFDSCSIRHVGTLGKSFTHSCLWRFDVKFRHSIRAVSEHFGVVEDLKMRYGNSLNEQIGHVGLPGPQPSMLFLKALS